jgi:predicted XRE-type DNA-binding protein
VNEAHHPNRCVQKGNRRISARDDPKENSEDRQMKEKKLKPQSLADLAKDWGIDYQTFKIKSELIDVLRRHCQENDISQRKLASMVPGLTQDRISKIFSGQVGHMTIDKLVAILSMLKIKVSVSAKAA